MIPSSRRQGSQPLNNKQFSSPTPYHLRTLVLDYLCHSCYLSTARAFARDSAIRHLDGDGDEIMSLAKGLEGDLVAGFMESVLRSVEHRDKIRKQLISGHVDAAIDLLEDHFPSVLSRMPVSSPESSLPSSAERIRYVAPTSVDPAHLSLNLRILAFIEACRTIPLQSTPPATHTDSGVEPYSPSLNHHEPEADDKRQADLLSRAQKLYTVVNLLQKPGDRATYAEELANVSGLLVYEIPEESPMSNYLSQERREAVADQIQSAILFRTGFPAISHVELYIRYTSTLWSFLHDLRVSPPPEANRPPGVQLPPTTWKHRLNPLYLKASALGKHDDEILPPFDLQQFLESKP